MIQMSFSFDSEFPSSALAIPARDRALFETITSEDWRRVFAAARQS